MSTSPTTLIAVPDSLDTATPPAPAGRRWQPQAAHWAALSIAGLLLSWWALTASGLIALIKTDPVFI